jgi:hypothetical protein
MTPVAKAFPSLTKTRLFNRKTIQELLGSYQAILEKTAQAPETKLFKQALGTIREPAAGNFKLE